MAKVSVVQSMDNLDKDTILVKIAKQFCPEHAQYIASPKLADKEEQRVVRQFVDALLYEEIVAFKSEKDLNRLLNLNNSMPYLIVFISSVWEKKNSSV